MSKTRFFKLNKLPLVLEQNSFYYIYGGDYAEAYVTDERGKPKPMGNTVMINELIDIKFVENGEIAVNTVTSHKSDFDAPSLFVYSGFLLNGIAIIKRTKENTEEFAQGVTDLETDWTNRLILTYI